MRSQGRTAAVLLILGCILFTTGGVMAAGEKTGIEFQYLFAKGMKLEYLVTVNGTVRVETAQGEQTNPIRIEMDIEQEVLEMVDGKAKVGVLIKGARTINGSDSAPLPEQGQYSTMLIDPLGNTQYLSGTGGWKGSEFSQLIFPRRPVAVGQTWLQEATSSVGPRTVSKSKFTFTGFTTFEKRECAVFDTLLDVESPQNPFQKNAGATTGTILFSRDLGQVVKTTAKTVFSFTLPLTQTGNVEAVTTTSLRIEMTLKKG